jgi:lipid-A-disaccharide synthase
MRYYLIAGEASGDLHGANLVKELARADQQAVFRGFGGDRMAEAGMTIVRHFRDMAFMGLIPVLMNLKTIRNNFRTCESDLLWFKPDVLILIDYPGFNLRMAEFAKQHNIRVFYYISPKIWAWKQRRVYKIKRLVDEMFTIFPFETEFYARFGYRVNYVGNPLFDAIQDQKKKPDLASFAKENKLFPDKPILAVLPGSRKTEISMLLPTMLRGVSALKEFQVVVAGAPSIEPAFYSGLVGSSGAKVIWGKTYELLQNSQAAVVASGTASLETGMLNVPQVVVYKMAGGVFFHLLGKIFIKTKWASLVNIILGREAVKELLQVNFTPRKIEAELRRILYDQAYRQRMMDSYKEMTDKMGEPGASARVARLIVEKLK